MNIYCVGVDFSDSCGEPEFLKDFKKFWMSGEERFDMRSTAHGKRVGTAKMIFFVGLTLLMSSRAALKPA